MSQLPGRLAVDARNLRVQIAGAQILKGVDLQVPRGGVTALLGRNGVGKTTTLRALLSLVPSSGHRLILGEDVDGWQTHQVVRLGVGYVPEDRDVFSGLTVEENLRLADDGKRPDYERVYGLFPELKLRSGQRAGTLSGGQQQMLAIARVLLAQRPLLLVDEPTKGLAPKLVDEVIAVLEQVGSQATVVLVEQNIHVVRRLASQVVVLDQGVVVHTGGVKDLEDADLVRQLVGVASTA